MNFMTKQFNDNVARQRFEYAIDSEITFADYRNEGDTVYIDYVEAPQKLRGTGTANELMRHIVDHLTKQGKKIVPVCSYAAAWMRKKHYT